MRQLRFLAPGFTAALLAAVGAGGCDDSSTSLVAVQLNLDRPVDVAFACYGGLRVTGSDGAQPTDPVVVSAQPLAACDLRSKLRAGTDPTPVPMGQEDLTEMGGPSLASVGYFGLILQSGPGTVALAQFPASSASTFSGSDVKILDADPLTPGKNSITVGVRPVAIATDRAGCFAVTANSGSCDLSTLELNSAIDRTGQAVVSRLAVKNAAGVPLDARPAAMVAEPGISTIGEACSGGATGLVYVAYPGCHLVAAVDVSTGTVVRGIHYAADGTPSIVDGNVTCPSECALGEVATAGPRPSTLDLVDDARPDVGTRRMVIGSNNSNALTLVELDPATTLPLSLSQVAFSDPTGDLGVLDVAMSPRIGMGGDAGKIDDEGAVGGHFQFAYAVTTDGTVRVADTLMVRRECEAQIDPRFVHDETDVRTLGCLPVDATKRRAGAVGPGIAVPSDGVAAAVNIIRVQAFPASLEDPRTKGPTRLIGTFGVISSTTGATYLVDIDDDDKADVEDLMTPLAVDLSTTLPHQLRDQVTNRGSVAEATADDGTVTPICNSTGPSVDSNGGLTGGARLSGDLNRLTLDTEVSSAKLGILPTVQQVQCVGSDATLPVPELSYVAPPAVREDRFPDAHALRATEDWRLVWEGLLTADTVGQDANGPAVRLGTVSVAGGVMKVTDRSRPYCAAGIEPYDLVQLRGCDPLATVTQCGLGTRCYLHPDSTNGVGACLPDKTADSLGETCRSFLISARRYTVGPDPKSRELTLLPRRRELRSTPLSGCTSTQQCTDLANLEAKQTSTLHPFEDNAVNSHTYACEADPSRKGGINRCMMTCTTDSNCDANSACVDGHCMEGVIPPSECIAGAQRYELRAADAFTVLGSVSGYLHPIIADGSGTCVRDLNANPLQIGRIPLSAPACTGTGTGITPNPCLTTVDQVETVLRYEPTTCAADPTPEMRTRSTSAILFRNPGFTLHLVDPTYPGDARCRGDRAGGLVDVPTVFAGFAMTFRLAGGFAPLALRTSATVPVRVVRGPQESIWVVDEGDYLSESSTVASTRGKVFRIEGTSLNVVNVMQ